jgi:thiamine biosynthesis protein ThiS
MINLILNGKRKELDSPITLLALLETLGVKSKFIAIGYNGSVVDKDCLDSIFIGDGDVLEVVKPVGGG